MKKHGGQVSEAMVRASQFGVACAGGAEALVHFRDAWERAAAKTEGAWAVIDVDLTNCFGSLEWASIREAAKTDVPGLAEWWR